MSDETVDLVMVGIAEQAFVSRIEPAGSQEERQQLWDSMSESQKLPHYREAFEAMRRDAVRDIVYQLVENPGTHHIHKDAPYLENGQRSWVDRIMEVVDAPLPPTLMKATAEEPTLSLNLADVEALLDGKVGDPANRKAVAKIHQFVREHRS